MAVRQHYVMQPIDRSWSDATRRDQVGLPRRRSETSSVQHTSSDDTSAHLGRHRNNNNSSDKSSTNVVGKDKLALEPRFDDVPTRGLVIARVIPHRGAPEVGSLWRPPTASARDDGTDAFRLVEERRRALAEWERLRTPLVHIVYHAVAQSTAQSHARTAQSHARTARNEDGGVVQHAGARDSCCVYVFFVPLVDLDAAERLMIESLAQDGIRPPNSASLISSSDDGDHNAADTQLAEGHTISHWTWWDAAETRRRFRRHCFRIHEVGPVSAHIHRTYCFMG